MKKRISFLLVAVLLLATLIPALPIFAADETTGGGAVENTFDASAGKLTISTMEDYFNFFKAAFCEKTDANEFAGKTITLMNDITFNDTTAPDWYTKEGVNKLPAGKAGWFYFKGTFDGNGHTLRGVVAQGAWADFASCGIFPFMMDGTIKNLNVDGFYVCSTNTTQDVASMGKGGIGGLIGAARRNVTIDNCSLKNGVVTSVKGGKGSIGGLIGSVTVDGTKTAIKITDTVVSNVAVDAGESLCENVGGLFGFLYSHWADGPFVLDFSGSVIQPTASMNSENPLKPVGVWGYMGNGTANYKLINQSIGHTEKDPGMALGGGTSMVFPGSGESFFKNSDDYCDGKIWDLCCYGYKAVPTVKLLGVQPGKTTNGVRFVGLVAKSVIDSGKVNALGFTLSVGDKNAEATCTKVYESILEDGETRTAPDGYYFFTFVVTDVTADTAFTCIAVATVDEKVCTTSAGAYTYSPTASSES